MILCTTNYAKELGPQLTNRPGRFNKIIEKALIGMSAGGERIVDIPKDFKIGDNIYDSMIQNSNMAYKISLMSVGKEVKNSAVCNE